MILETLASIGRHVTAEDLLRDVRTRDARIGAATVYRTLRVLQDSGIVAERHFEGGASRFELLGDDHHDHLICTVCGTIVEFEDDIIEHEQKRVASAHGFELLMHRHRALRHLPELPREQRDVAPRPPDVATLRPLASAAA